MCIPFRNWLVETTSAIGAQCSQVRDDPVPTTVRCANRFEVTRPSRQLLRERGQQLDPVVADDRQVLDPHAADARQVDARLDRDDVARLEHVAATRSRGAAPRAPSSPTPWPRPWPKCSPKPAVGRSRRARAASASTPVMPGRIRSTRARCCASRQTSYARAQLVGQRRPVANVRVQSRAVAVEPRAPVDDDERPRLDDRVAPAAACGLAPFGPEATIACRTTSSSAPCACRSSRSRHASSRSLRPTHVSAVSASKRAVGDARARGGSASTSLVVLDRAQRLDDAASSARARARPRPSTSPLRVRQRVRLELRRAPSSRSARSRDQRALRQHRPRRRRPRAPPRCSGSR